jgi:hypothetical protein
VTCPTQRPTEVYWHENYDPIFEDRYITNVLERVPATTDADWNPPTCQSNAWIQAYVVTRSDGSTFTATHTWGNGQGWDEAYPEDTVPNYATPLEFPPPTYQSTNGAYYPGTDPTSTTTPSGTTTSSPAESTTTTAPGATSTTTTTTSGSAGTPAEPADVVLDPFSSVLLFMVAMATMFSAGSTARRSRND